MREGLPALIPENQSYSIWAILKGAIGKDMTKITMPIWLNEPISMLQKISDLYDNEVEATLASLTAAIEPIMIVGLGFVVGFIVISMFLPLVDVISKLSSGGGDDK
jgi:hypothetical protein